MNRFVVAFLVVLAILFAFHHRTKAGSVPASLVVDKHGIQGQLEKDRLTLKVPVRNQSAESLTASGKFQVVDLEGKSYGLNDRIFAVKGKTTQDITVQVPLRVAIGDNPGFYNLNYRVITQGKSISGVRSLLPMMHPYSVRLLAGDRFSPGQQAGLRVIAFRTGSGIPIQGVSVAGRLTAGDKSFELFQGSTLGNGSLPVRFTIPQAAPGSYDLVVDANFSGVKQRISAGVQLEPMYRIYIVSDKPIYQPSQTIHFRALTLSSIQNAPATTHDFTWEIYDPKGNRLFKKSSKTDRFGVASGDFELAEEVNLGVYKIRGTVRSGSFEQFSEKDVTVSRYVLPKFKVEVDTPRNFYLPGEKVSGEIRANYFFGKPVEGKVDITASKFDIGFTDIWSRSVDLRNGKATFEFALPPSFAGTPLEQGNAFVEIKAIVEDTASQEYETTKKLTVTADPILVAAIPASLKLISGVENRLLVVTQYPDRSPAKTEVQFANQRVSTNDSGVAVVKFVPGGTFEYLVKVKDAAGKTASRTLKFDTAGQGLIITPSKGFYRVGETLNLQVFSNISKTVYIDFIKNNQTLKTEAIDTDAQRAASSTDLSADFVGSVLVNAYSISRDGEIYRDSKWIVVEPATELNIDVKADQASYKPGEKGKLRFRVTDQKGQGVAAALGVAIVDEAVFAVSELRPGLEKIYFLLEEALQKPRYEIHGLSFGPLMEEPVRDQVKAEATLATAEREYHYDVNLDSYDTAAKKFKSRFEEQLGQQYYSKMEKVGEAIQKYYDRYKKYPAGANALKELVEKKLLLKDLATDPWGELFLVESAQAEITPWNLSLVSKGPDELAGTADDVAISARMWMMQEMVLEAPMAGAPRMQRDVVMMKKAEKADGGGEGGGEPRVREYFPETLLFEPAVITDAAGNAVLDVPLADSITEWRVSVTGSSATGALGSTTSSVRVFQDFFVDLDLPVALTSGDEVSVPVAVYNYLPQQQNVKLELQQAAWFAPLESSSMNVMVQPNEVSSAYFRIRAERLGKQKLVVKAYGSKLSDAVQRELIVEPNGQKMEDTVNGRLSADVSASIAFPPEAIAESRQLLLKVYPGIFNQLLEGLDSILQMPFGCFEQTSSSTYPNVLALQYMKKTGKATPEIRMKAEGYINLGYQRLVTFEVPGGGFSWFGDAPANQILTAYGVMEFKDMGSVYEIDPNLLQRTAEWLISRQQEDGSWKPDEGGIAEGAINRYQKDRVRIASYIGWALARAGAERQAVDRAAAFVRKNFNSVTDPYGLAVAANFLLEHNSKDAAGRNVLAKLFALKVEDTDTIHWKQEEPTAVYSEGPSAYVETTALATLAFLKEPEYAGAVGKMLTYLIKQKDPRGTWYSTQATIWALKAFIESMGGRREATDAVVDVIVNGKAQKQVMLNETNADVLQMINVTETSNAGLNQVQLKMHGKAQALFALIARYAVPWKDRKTEALEITVSYDKTTLDVDDTAVARVTIHSNLRQDAEMVIVDLGIPPGFRISTDDLDSLAQKNVIEKYSLTGRQAILYIEKIQAGSTVQFSYHLTAKFPIKAGTMPVRVYEYYNPQREDVAVPVQMLVR